MEKKGKEAKAKVLWKLFISTLYLSAFTFGGGYVIVTLMKKKFVDDLHWIDEKEMLDLVAIAQSSPGAIAVNGAIVVGYKLAGIAGVLVSILGTMLPPFVIISVISAFYQAFRSNFFISQMLEGMQAGVGAVIASVTYESGNRKGEGCRFGRNHDRSFYCLLYFRSQCSPYHFGLWSSGCDSHSFCKKEGNEMIYIQLFFSFLQVGLFSFGGGYAAMPLIQGQVVTMHQWLSMSEFTDLITISQMTPGPIAVNSATFVGIKVAGLPGAIAATAGCILPSCILVTVIAKLYLKYRNMELLRGVLGSLRPAVVAMIASAGILILISAFWGSASAISFEETKWSMVVIFILCVISLRKTKINPVWVMVLAGLMKAGLALTGQWV